jgi:LacI family transcriptional regulator
MQPTIKDVAKSARVSVGTVSNVLNGATQVTEKLRQRVEKAIRDLDFHPNSAARSLKSRRMHMLGVVISDLTNPFFPLLIRGAEDAAAQEGYILNIYNTDDRLDREKQVFGLLRSRRVDGALTVLAPSDEEPAHIRALLDSGIPIVCMDRAANGLDVDIVAVDNFNGALLCGRHLLSLGHSLVGVISGPAQLQTSRERVRGFRSALTERGLKLPAELLRAGDYRFASGCRLALELYSCHPRPTALFVTNGTMGLGAVKALDEAGLRCPDDMALAVFDAVPGAEVLHPRLTVVSQPAYEIGFQAATLLIRRISGQERSAKPVRITLQPELQINESTCRLTTGI